MNERGQYGRRHVGRPWSSPARAAVGAVLFHGLSDRDTAAEQINTQLMTIARAVVSAAGGDPTLVYPAGGFLEFTKTHAPGEWIKRVAEARDAMAKKKSPLLPLWEDAVAPLWSEWISFYGDRKHWYDAVTEAFTSWEDYLSWAKRVNALRDKVEAAGVHIALPRLESFSESLQEKLEGGLGDIWKIGKYGLIAVIGVGVVVALSSAASNLRSHSA